MWSECGDFTLYLKPLRWKRNPPIFVWIDVETFQIQTQWNSNYQFRTLIFFRLWPTVGLTLPKYGIDILPINRQANFNSLYFRNQKKSNQKLRLQ